MYKKIGVSLLALILMFNFTFKDYADAAIASKAAGQAAKQVAKEVIQDIAVETAANFALQQAMDIVEGYESKPGFKTVCADGSAKCDKPIQVKTEITETDKQAIKGQAGTELDKLLNGGNGVSKWQKFLDWFLPVWLISFGATALTYAFDSDVRSLFNEAAYNALVALGFIIPASKNLNPKEQEENLEVLPDGTYTGSTGLQEKINPAEMKGITGNSGRTLSVYPAGASSGKAGNANDSLLVTTVDYTDVSATSLTVVGSTSSESGYMYGLYDSSFYVASSAGANPVTVKVNGETRYSGTTNSGYGGRYIDTTEIGSLLSKKMKSIRSRAPYQVGAFYYTDVLYETVAGDIIETQARTSSQSAMYNNVRSLNVGFIYNTTAPFTANIKLYTNVPKGKIIQVGYTDIEEQGGMEKSNYESEKGNVALIPPSALTYKEESTGETVYRVPAAVPTNPPVFQKEDGTPVPEEEITVEPAPNVTPAPNGTTTEKGEPIPEGTPIVTPAPTPSNPAPAPIPLTPAPTPTPTTPTPEPTTPVEPPANGEPPTTGEPIPEGPGCEEKIKFPILSPLKETFSTSFPFSIPWDIERAINAAFSGIGHEKPKFNLDLNVLGQKETIEITTPKMFDDWKPFTDTLLVLTFDVLIMFGVYRFVKGAGS